MLVPFAYFKPSVIAASYLLDLYPATSGYSMCRKLSSSQSYAFRIRRDSDNSEMDIGFDANGDTDVSALSSFVGSASGYLVTLYDSMGLYNLTQNVSSAQLMVVNSGSLITLNNKLSAYSDGSVNRFMLNSSYANFDGLDNQIFQVGQINSGVTAGQYVITNAAAFRGVVSFCTTTTNYAFRIYQSVSTVAVITSVVRGAQRLIEDVVISGNMNVYDNGSQAGPTVVTTGSGITSTRLYLGTFNTVYTINGYVQEKIFYNQDTTPNQIEIRNNINNYYQIF